MSQRRLLRGNKIGPIELARARNCGTKPQIGKPVVGPKLFYNGSMAGLNLLYLLGHLTGSKWDCNEIRYSLRSMSTTNQVDWVGITGPEMPPFFKGVEHIKVEIRDGQKFHNLLMQLLTAMNNPYVPEDLILMNDDFFMRDTPKWDWTPTFMGEAPERPKNAWQRSVRFTADKLIALGFPKPIMSYEGHTPMPIKKSLALNTLVTIIPWAAEKQVQFRTAYGNLNRIGGALHTNAKHKTMDKWPADSPFLSLQNTVKDEYKEFLAKTWPNPSRWEV